SLALFEGFGDRQSAATAKLLLGLGELQRGGPSGDAERLVTEAGATFAELGDAWGEATAAQIRFQISAYQLGPGGRVEAYAERALELVRALDDPWGVAITLMGLGGLSHARGDVGATARWFEQALAAAGDGGGAA